MPGKGKKNHLEVLRKIVIECVCLYIYVYINFSGSNTFQIQMPSPLVYSAEWTSLAEQNKPPKTNVLKGSLELLQSGFINIVYFSINN